MPVTSPGLKGIVAATTRLSDVMGEEGILIYAGYNINELAGHVSYEEVVYLLWNDELPNKAQLEKLKGELRAARELPAPVVDFLKNAPKDANPMDVLRTGVSMLGLYDHRAGRPADAGAAFPARHFADGEGRRDRRLFPPRAPGQGAAADPHGPR